MGEATQLEISELGWLPYGKDNPVTHSEGRRPLKIM